MNMHSVGCLGGSVVLGDPNILGGFNMQRRNVGHFEVMYSTYVRLMRQKSIYEKHASLTTAFPGQYVLLISLPPRRVDLLNQREIWQGSQSSS